MVCPKCRSDRVKPLLPADEDRPAYVCKNCNHRWRMQPRKSTEPPAKPIAKRPRKKR